MRTLLKTPKQRALFGSLSEDEEQRVLDLLERADANGNMEKDPDRVNNGVIAFLQNYRMAKLTRVLTCECLAEDADKVAVRVRLRVKDKETVAHIVVPGRSFEQAQDELLNRTGFSWSLIESSAESIHRLCVER